MKLWVARSRRIARFLVSKKLLRVILRYIWQNRENGFIRSIYSGIKRLLNPPAVLPTITHRPTNSQMLVGDLEMLQNTQKTPPFANKLSPTLIVIPIYNGFDCVEKCLLSALQTPSIHQVLAVDDCSTDPRILDLLQRYKATYPGRFDWIQTPSNVGFPGAANLGLKHYSNRDVLLLNSDAIIPANAIEQMNQAFLYDKRVASVTPLTNSGTIANIPMKFIDCNMPDLEIHKKLQEILEQDHAFQDPKNWPEIPTAVGFAMLINGGALRTVGDFDEKTFSPGYGEENDWSRRAINLGYRNLLNPTTFVYHASGQSYGQKKFLLMQQHGEILNLRYPTYHNEVQTFSNSDTLQTFREAVFLLGISRCKDIDINIVIDHQQSGGATKILNEELAANPDIFYIILSKATINEVHWSFRFRNMSLKHSGTHSDFLQITSIFDIQKTILNTMALVIDSEFPEFTQRIVLPLLKKAKTREFRLHDYHSICPSLNLINNQGSFCDVPDSNVCNSCLPKNPFKITSHAGSILEWRNPWEEIFKTIDKVICYSQESCERITRVFPQLKDRTVLQLYEVFDYSRALTYELGEVNLQSLRIATVGNLHYAKGSQVVVDLAQAILDVGLTHKIEHFGVFSSDISPKLPIVVHGKYRDSRELILSLKQLSPEIILIPSIGPETFSLVAEELKNSSIPIVMFNLGAPYERHKENNSFHFIKPVFGLELLKEIVEIAKIKFKQSI